MLKLPLWELWESLAYLAQVIVELLRAEASQDSRRSKSSESRKRMLGLASEENSWQKAPVVGGGSSEDAVEIGSPGVVV